MTRVSKGHWKHKGFDIWKSDGWYVAGWNSMLRPYMADTLSGMISLINRDFPKRHYQS